MPKLSLLKRWYIRHRLPEHSDWGRMVLISAGWAMMIYITYLIFNK